MDDRQIDVAAVADDPLVENPRRLEHHRKDKPVDDGPLVAGTRGERIGGDHRRHAVVGPLDPGPGAGAAIAIKSSPALPPQAPGLDHCRDHRRGLDPIAVGIVENEAGIERRVEADHVVELEGAHRHPEGPGGPIDFPRIDSGPQHLHRFVEIGHEHPVDEKPRTVTDDNRTLPQPFGVGNRPSDGGVGGGRSAHHLDEHHPPDRIEEVETTESRRIAERLGELRDRVGGGVGGDDGIRPDDRLDLGKHLPFDVCPLEDALDDEIGIGQRRGVRDGA